MRVGSREWLTTGLGLGLISLLAVSCSASAHVTNDDRSRSPHSVTTIRPRQTSADPRPAATVVPSPPPPPFGYCGGLRSATDARYIATGGEAVAVVSATITGAGHRILHPSGDQRALPVSHVQLLAGHLPGGFPSTIDYTGRLLPGPYLLVLGGTNADDNYPAFGNYGVYRINGTHAYRSCYDWNQQRAHVVRRGITSIHGLIRIFHRALR